MCPAVGGLVFAGIVVVLSVTANTGHSPNAVYMLAQRLRRWPNIKTALGECPVSVSVITCGLGFLHSPAPGSVMSSLIDAPDSGSFAVENP